MRQCGSSTYVICTFVGVAWVLHTFCRLIFAFGDFPLAFPFFQEGSWVTPWTRRLERRVNTSLHIFNKTRGVAGESLTFCFGRSSFWLSGLLKTPKWKVDNFSLRPESPELVCQSRDFCRGWCSSGPFLCHGDQHRGHELLFVLKTSKFCFCKAFCNTLHFERFICLWGWNQSPNNQICQWKMQICMKNGRCRSCSTGVDKSGEDEALSVGTSSRRFWFETIACFFDRGLMHVMLESTFSLKVRKLSCRTHLLCVVWSERNEVFELRNLWNTPVI